jgi:hypothetical protein
VWFVYAYARSREVWTIEYGGPQASSSDETNISLPKQEASPSASHSILDFYFLINTFMLRMIVHYIDRSWLEP